MDGLWIDLDSLFWHPTGGGGRYLCVGDYFLEGDGDQLLIEPGAPNASVVFYYAHGGPETRVRHHAQSIADFLERLPEEYLSDR